jgi:hypothetical protein
MPNTRLAHCRLYGFIDTAYLGDRDPADLTRTMIDGGVDMIQVRAKEMTHAQRVELGMAVLGAASPLNVPVIINDADNAVASVTLGDMAAYKAELFKNLNCAFCFFGFYCGINGMGQLFPIALKIMHINQRPDNAVIPFGIIFASARVDRHGLDIAAGKHPLEKQLPVVNGPGLGKEHHIFKVLGLAPRMAQGP